MLNIGSKYIDTIYFIVSLYSYLCTQLQVIFRDGQNHNMLMILKSNHLNKGDLKSKSFWKWWFENQNHIENQMILKSF